MSKPKIVIDNGYYFITSLFLFAFNAVFILVALSQNFKNSTDLFSLFFSIAGFFIILKTFITGYANLAYSIIHKRYYVLVTNVILISFQLTCFFLALYWFQNDTYPQVTTAYFLLASFGLAIQLVLGNLTSSIKYQLISIVYHGILLGMLYIRLFNADVRFLQIAGFISFSLELLLLLNIYRTFQLKDVAVIKAKTA